MANDDGSGDGQELRAEDLVPERVAQFAMTVGSVWREARVSCPHPDLLRAYHDGGLSEEQREYIRFHVEDAACPYCQATLEDMARADADAASAPLDNLKERLLSSTMSVLREKRARDSK